MSAAEVLQQAFRDADNECDWDSEGHALHALDALKAAGYEIVQLPEVKADERGRYQVPGTDIHVDYRGLDGGEFSLWVWNSVRGSTLQKRYEAGVGRDLAATILAAEAAEVSS